MAQQKKARSAFIPMPMLSRETLYIGVDIGKFRHVAGFLSRTLLARHGRFEGCPTLVFEQSREGFRSFVDRIRELVPLEQATGLIEHTGHYHRLLEQYLLEVDITVYRVHVQERPKGMLKTDKRDALRLANMLYTQLELGAKARGQNATGPANCCANEGSRSPEGIDPTPRRPQPSRDAIEKQADGNL